MYFHFGGKTPTHFYYCDKNTSLFVSCTSMKITPPPWREDCEGQPQWHPNTSGGRAISKPCPPNTSRGREDQENLKQGHQNIFSGREDHQSPTHCHQNTFSGRVDRPGQRPCRQNTISGREDRPGQHPCHQHIVSRREDRPGQQPCRQNTMSGQASTTTTTTLR